MSGDLPYRPCVGVMLINAAGLIFAGQRIDAPAGAAAAWQMPQGGIDEGEKPRAAALRELWEETGVTAELVTFVAKTDDWVTYDLPPELLGKVWGGKYKGQRQKWFLFRFDGRDDQINIASGHPEFARWQWMRADDMLAAIVPFKRAVYDEVIGSFRAHLA
ncbi:MAG: RNA pyrophosphohydrolase [Paracoccaceae bacterium]